MTRLLFFVLAVALTVCGCTTSTHFSRLPRPDEFAKPLAQLQREYPDLTRFSSPGVFVTVYDMPEAQALIDAWQPPHATGFTAWMLLPPMWLFHPSSYWYWNFADKRVAALIDRPLTFVYAPHVWQLRVEAQPAAPP